MRVPFPNEMTGDFTIPKPLAVVAAAGYHVVQKTWEQLFERGIKQAQQASIPVISIGNLSMGGTGKTPFAIFLATMLTDLGMKPAVISRGYRGANRERYLVVADGASAAPLVGADVAGDEPFLLASRLGNVPVLVGRKRIFPVEAARSLLGCDVAILDDGFQHHQLRRDLNIVLLSGKEDRMFPVGNLREPLSALRRADLIVLTGGQRELCEALRRYAGNTPVFPSRTVPISVETGGDTTKKPAATLFGNADVVLVSGIANPERFRVTAENLGWRVRDHCCFPDHHAFSDDELKALLARYPEVPLVFTEKDRVKLPQWFVSLDRVAVLCVGLVVENESGLRQLIRDKLRLE